MGRHPHSQSGTSLNGNLYLHHICKQEYENSLLMVCWWGGGGGGAVRGIGD